MAVRADYASYGISNAHAVAHLGNGRFIVISHDFERAILETFGLWRKFDSHLCRFSHIVLGACRIAKTTPCGHGPLSWALNTRIWIDTRLYAECAGAILI